MSLFTGQISNWNEWGDIFQSIPAFMPLVGHILAKEKLPMSTMENLTPGTNAVFKVGEYVIKIFAPTESGMDQSLDLQTELFATSRANRLGISAPQLITHGVIDDKYRFAYMITEYIHGTELVDAVKHMTDTEKTDIARRLRRMTDTMNTPCESFNGIDVINDKGRYRRWDDRYSDSFKSERLDYIKSHDFGEKVFVHGDLCLDNILLTPQRELFIIDFADAVLAPRIYEHALMPFSFELDPALIRGYFADYSAAGFIEMCFNGLLIHDFGGDIVMDFLKDAGSFEDLGDLRRGIRRKLEEASLHFAPYLTKV